MQSLFFTTAVVCARSQELVPSVRPASDERKFAPASGPEDADGRHSKGGSGCRVEYRSVPRLPDGSQSIAVEGSRFCFFFARPCKKKTGDK